MANANASKLSLYGGIAANIAIAVSKFVAAYFTGSSAMLSEGIHSLVDTGNSGLLLYGTHQSERPADAEHPFGHSKELYFWGLIVAVLIFAIGGGMSFYEGIKHIQHPEPLEDAGLELRGAGAVLSVRRRGLLPLGEGPAGPGRCRHGLREDAAHQQRPGGVCLRDGKPGRPGGPGAGGLGVFLGHWLNNPYFDGGASIAIGLLLMLVAVFLVGRTKGLLVGTGVDAATLANLERIARDQPQVREIRSPLTMYLGPNDVMLALDVDFADDLTSSEVATAVERLQDAIRAEHPEVQRIFIEAKNLAKATER